METNVVLLVIFIVLFLYFTLHAIVSIFSAILIHTNMEIFKKSLEMRADTPEERAYFKTNNFLDKARAKIYYKCAMYPVFAYFCYYFMLRV